MANLATWMRPKDERWFRPFFAKHPDIHVFDARKGNVPMDQMDGLLLTGGSDIAAEFLRQENVDPTLIDKDDLDPKRDRWEFHAIAKALAQGLPILAKSKRGALMTMSSSKCACAIIRLRWRSNIIPSVERFMIRSLKISLPGSNR